MTVAQTSYDSAMNNISGSYVPNTTAEDPYGQEAFLELLVTQMQNQDPLDPMDSSEFTSQLTQYSQLEQQMMTNDTLEEIAAGLTSQSTGVAGVAMDYMGKEILAEGNTLEVSSGSAARSYSSSAGLGSQK